MPSSTPTPLLPESLTTAELHQRLNPFAGAGPVSEDAPACRLPCYNGLVAGESGVEDVMAFYARLGIGAADLIPGDYRAAQDGTGRLGAWLTKTSDVARAEELGLTPPLVDVYVEEGVVQVVYVAWQYAPPYLALPDVLGALGRPDQLELALLFDAQLPTYARRLLYPELRAGFAYAGEAEADATGLRVCPTGEGVGQVFLGLFAPGVPPMAGLAGSEAMLPLTEALGIAYEDFAAWVGGEGCLPVPAERWAAWQSLGEE